MRKLVGALLHSLPDFIHVGSFLAFIFILFAILGVHQFNGTNYQRCRLTEKPPPGSSIWPIAVDLDRSCSQGGIGSYECPAGYFCGDPAEFNLPISQDS